RGDGEPGGDRTDHRRLGGPGDEAPGAGVVGEDVGGQEEERGEDEQGQRGCAHLLQPASALLILRPEFAGSTGTAAPEERNGCCSVDRHRYPLSTDSSEIRASDLHSRAGSQLGIQRGPGETPPRPPMSQFTWSGRYAPCMEYFDDRRRAESFGEVASDYDAYRPQYPAELIAAIMQAAEAAAETRTQTSSNAATDSGPDSGTDTVAGTGPDARVPRILDVGSGTGILASQLREAGAKILAVEPDAEMAAVARAKGLEVEVSSFEGWDRCGRTFDLVSFGQSFHWVDPMIALPRIRTLLEPGGSLALAWNDIEVQGELQTR